MNNKKIYIIMGKQYDCEFNTWEILEDDEHAFLTKEIAQKYINKNFINPEDYFILELQLIEV